jgi:hypothetical protein
MGAIPPDYWNSAEQTACRACGERVIALVFPARNAAPAAAAPATLGAEGEASCFYHADHQAVAACEECGRFLCSLCELDLDGRRLCPACLERGVNLEKAASLETQRVQYDSLAIHLTTWPILTFWLPLFTAPAALYLVLRHWKTPMSILPRSRARLWIALLLAVGQILAIAALIVLAIRFAPQVPPPSG